MIESPNQATGNGKCPRCGTANALHLGQSSRHGKLRWYETVNCEQCGLHSEADGTGVPPEEIRKRIIEVTGLWRVNVVEVKSSASLVRVMRDALGLEMKDAARIAKGLPGIVYSGTRGEGDWLVELIEKAGEHAVLQNVG